MSNVPKLRFSEFSGEWKDQQLGKIAKFSKGKGISKSDVSVNGKQPCIRYGQLYTLYNETIKYVSTYTNVSSNKLVLSKANDVIIPASGETQEDIATASCMIDSGIALGGDLNIIRSKMNGVFLSYYLNSAKKKSIAQLAQGISVVHLYSSQLERLNINIPSIPEQQKIANCLSSIDTLITAQTQKLDTLKAHKKGLMQQLFPATGETIPKRRFPEFRYAGDWEEKPLGEVVKFLDGKRKPIKESDRASMQGRHPYYGASGIIDYVNNFIFDEDLILLGEDGENIVSRNLPLVFKVSGKYWVNNHAHVLKPKKPHSLEFLVQYMETLSYIKYNSGGAQPKLNQAVCKTIPLILPLLPEQQKIANCLSSIDDLITAQTKKIESLKAHKKGLMQQLFPASEEMA